MHPISGYFQEPLCQKHYFFWNYHNHQVHSNNWRKKSCNKNVDTCYSALDGWDIYLAPAVRGKHQTKKCSWALCQPVTPTERSCSTTTREIKTLVSVCAQREREFQNIHLSPPYLNTYNCVLHVYYPLLNSAHHCDCCSDRHCIFWFIHSFIHSEKAFLPCKCINVPPVSKSIHL